MGHGTYTYVYVCVSTYVLHARPVGDKINQTCTSTDAHNSVHYYCVKHLTVNFTAVWSTMDGNVYLFNTCHFAGELSEYCLTEIFTPHCAPDHVVVMTTAMFGRMHIGRCVTKSFGYVGCGWNVIGVLDRYCSGRRSCEVRVAPIQYELPRTDNCPKDLKRFLLAEYRCING